MCATAEGRRSARPRRTTQESGHRRKWCLQATGRSPGDFGLAGWKWTDASRSWLRDVLGDSIVQVTDEDACRAIAEILNRELLGWQVGPPPVVIFRVRDYLIAYPSNARVGEFEMAVGMGLDRRIRGVATW